MMHAAIFRSGILLALATLGASTATAQTELYFATGVDSTGWAEAQSNDDGHVLIESPQYPHGLWLHLVDDAGDALAGLQVEYQGRPDSLVAIRCVDPVGSVRETLIWTRPDGGSLRLMLKPTGLDDLPAGLTSIDWRIDPTARALLEPVNETRLIGWEAVSSFLQAHWQYQTGRVSVQLNASTSFAVELHHPEIIEMLVAHLQQMYQPAETSLGKSTVLNVRVLSEGSALQEGVILYLPLFADANLERVVREALGRPHGGLTPEDVSFLTSISARDASISSLTGLENCTALDKLSLIGNQITDITPLANLNNLKKLTLWSNQITDIAPLANLNNLQVLTLESNQIADITPLANLNNLRRLRLANNHIAEVGPLAGLYNLQVLRLWSNQITDITPLANLNNLKKLDLWSNQITDITPLANLNSLPVLYLSSNQIADITPLANLNNLQSLYLYDNQIADITPLANLNNLQVLGLSSNQVEDISALVANTGLGEGDEVHLTGNPLSDKARNEQIPALQARGVDVSY